MIVLGLLLMIIGFLSKDITMWVFALFIALLVKYRGYDLLFKDYDEKVGQIRAKYRKKEGVE